MNIYEMYGRLAESSQELQTFHAMTMDLLKKLKAGEVDPSKLALTENGWKIQQDA